MTIYLISLFFTSRSVPGSKTTGQDVNRNIYTGLDRSTRLTNIIIDFISGILFSMSTFMVQTIYLYICTEVRF